MFWKSFLFCFVLSVNTLAQTPAVQAPEKPKTPEPQKAEFKIRQILIQQKTLIVQSSQSAMQPTGFVVTLSDESQCDLAFKSANQNLIYLDMSSCAKSNLINLKSGVEPALSAPPLAVATKPAEVPVDKNSANEVPVNTSVSEVSTERRAPHFSLGLNLSSMSNFYFANAKAKDYATNDISTANVKFNTDMGTGLNASFLLWGPHAWGFSVGGFYEFARDVNSVSSGSSTSSYSKLRITIYGLEGNMIYRWNRWYLPFGFNYTMVEPDNYVGTVTVTGGLGTQVGAGFLLSKNTSIELMAKLVTFSIEEYGSGYSINYGTGYGAGWNANWRLVF